MSLTKVKGLTAEDKALLAKVNKSVAAYDHADETGGTTSDQLRLKTIAGNPPFKAQFDVSMIIKYFSVAAGTYTAVTAAALLAAEATLATQVPAFIFGNSDFASGFKKSRGQFPLSGWTYDTPFIYGRDFPNTEYGELDATAKAVLQVGDLVQPFYASPGATDYVAFVIVRCQQVGYATLLDS